MNNKKSNYNIFDKLKLNSWEVEILIVGFLLVVLLQIPESLMNEIRIAKINVDVISSFSKAISILGVYLTLFFAAKIITITLSVYIILRSFWVGLLGLSSVFPKGINIKKIKYNKYFMNKINSYDLDVSINQIDKISSTIFSFAFLLTLSTISFLMIILTLVIIFSCVHLIGFNNLATIEDIISLVYLSIAGIYIFDYLSFGLVKKIKWKPIAFIYYYIYIYFNYVTLGFIYNSLYYTYISNIKARYIILPLSTIIVLIYFNNTNDLIDFSYQEGSRNNSTTFVTSYKYYEDEREGISLEHPFIQSYIINEPFLNLNIPYKADINSGLKKICPDIGTYNQTSELDSIIYFQSEAIECINSYYSISIDSIRINSNFIFKTYSEIYNTFNMIIPLNNFETGTHAIHIIPPDTAITSHSYQETNYIPFYFIGNN